MRKRDAKVIQPTTPEADRLVNDLLDQARELEGTVFDEKASTQTRVECAEAWLALHRAACDTAAPNVPHYEQDDYHPRLMELRTGGLVTFVAGVTVTKWAPDYPNARIYGGSPPKGWTPPTNQKN